MSLVKIVKNSRGAAFLAVVALVCAMLPGGYLPRFTGPCGQNLCLCQLQVFSGNASIAPESLPVAPESRWIIVEQISENEGQLSVVAGSQLLVEVTERITLISASTLLHDTAPSGALLEASSVVLDYPTPPPRVSA